ncbi:MAG: hypothetical protein LH478_13005 [Chitinophagaceae bacterium]|nr:hypothetical protein [Chitinophagaceae bacterium]
MFSNPKNKGKLISFLIAFSLVIITTFFVNENKKEIERISGRIAVIDKNMEAGLSNFLFSKSNFSQAMMYNTLGLMHIKSGHTFSYLYIPFKDEVINGILSINESLGQGDARLNPEQIQSIDDAFSKSAADNSSTGFITVFNSALVVFQKLSLAYEASILKQANDKLRLKNNRGALEVKASLLTWLAVIIGFVQLFFNSFYDMYTEYKKPKI